MAENCFHPSIEGAQHGAKTLAQFLDYAKASGAAGAQPSNFMLHEGDGFKSVNEIQSAFAQRGLTLDGVSAHCPFWVHTTAWTNSPTVRPFIPADVAGKSPAGIEQWAEDYILRLLDLCAALNVKIVPMFWGVAFGWELANLTHSFGQLRLADDCGVLNGIRPRLLQTVSVSKPCIILSIPTSYFRLKQS